MMMKFCCFLLLLIITFITGSESAVSSVTVKLHESAVLPCSGNCTGVVRWILPDDPQDPFAECDQTSCKVKDGYQMNYHQYLKGDYSLTITKTDFNKRDTYKSRCGLTEMCKVLLQVTALRSTVQRTVGESLEMKLNVSDPVEVIYSRTEEAGASSDQICTVNKTLQCKPEYNHRASLISSSLNSTSLISSDLELRGMKESDSGVYIIRDIITKEEIHIYTVIIDTPPLPVWVITLITVVVLLVIIGTTMILRSSQIYIKIQKLNKAQQNLNTDLLKKEQEKQEKKRQGQEEEAKKDIQEKEKIKMKSEKETCEKIKDKLVKQGGEDLQKIIEDLILRIQDIDKKIPIIDERIDQYKKIVEHLTTDKNNLDEDIKKLNEDIEMQEKKIKNHERILSGEVMIIKKYICMFCPWRSSCRKKKKSDHIFWEDQEKIEQSIREEKLSHDEDLERLTEVNNAAGDEEREKLMGKSEKINFEDEQRRRNMELEEIAEDVL